jgi:hypothetical protein
MTDYISMVNILFLESIVHLVAIRVINFYT